MPNSPGVSVSQIATQLETFDQMRFELVSFQYGGWWPFSARVPWQRSMDGQLLPLREPPASKLSGYTQGRGRPVLILHSEALETAVPQLHRWAGNPHFLRSADSGCHQWLYG